jgi:hypothetical protein
LRECERFFRWKTRRNRYRSAGFQLLYSLQPSRNPRESNRYHESSCRGNCGPLDASVETWGRSTLQPGIKGLRNRRNILFGYAATFPSNLRWKQRAGQDAQYNGRSCGNMCFSWSNPSLLYLYHSPFTILVCSRRLTKAYAQATNIALNRESMKAVGILRYKAHDRTPVGA